MPPYGDVDAPLQVDAARGGGTGRLVRARVRVLAEFRDECRIEDEPSPHVRLWPEHFDAAVDVGTGDRGGTYGMSPGDRFDPHPYVYASRWGENPPDPFYDSPFGGAWLSLRRGRRCGRPARRGARVPARGPAAAARLLMEPARWPA